MALPLIGAGATAGRGLLSYLAKKKLQKELALKAAVADGRVAAIKDTAATYGAGLGAGILGTGAYNELKDDKTTREYILGRNLSNKEESRSAQEAVDNPVTSGGPLSRGNPFNRQIARTHAFFRPGGRWEQEYYAKLDEEERERMETNKNMIRHFEKIDSMNLTHQAKEILKENYLRKLENQWLQEEKSGIVKEDYNLESNGHTDAYPEETGTAYTGGELDTFMGMPLKEKLIESGKFLADPTGLWRKGISNMNEQFGIGEGTEAEKYFNSLFR